MSSQLAKIDIHYETPSTLNSCWFFPSVLRINYKVNVYDHKNKSWPGCAVMRSFSSRGYKSKQDDLWAIIGHAWPRTLVTCKHIHLNKWDVAHQIGQHVFSLWTDIAQSRMIDKPQEHAWWMFAKQEESIKRQAWYRCGLLFSSTSISFEVRNLRKNISVTLEM